MVESVVRALIEPEIRAKATGVRIGLPVAMIKSIENHHLRAARDAVAAQDIALHGRRINIGVVGQSRIASCTHPSRRLSRSTLQASGHHFPGSLAGRDLNARMGNDQRQGAHRIRRQRLHHREHPVRYLIFDPCLRGRRRMLAHRGQTAGLRRRQVVTNSFVEAIEFSRLAKEEHAVAFPHHRREPFGQRGVVPRLMTEDDLQRDPLEETIEVIPYRYWPALAVRRSVA